MSQAKKLLILGATRNQVPLIKAARAEGYYVVDCDWTTTNPGLPYVNKHYQVSTLDREAVLKVARQEQVHGVISNSESAMVNVAYIAETLGLVGNSVQGIETLSSKDRFRSFQESIGLYAPKHGTASDRSVFFQLVNEIGFPLIVKPVECTGTRGTERFDQLDREKMDAAFEQCQQYSLNHKVAVEEFVEMPSLTLIDGDVFLCNGDILWDGMFFSSRCKAAPMVPVTQSYPLRLEDRRMIEVKQSLEKVFSKLGIVHGEYNVEMYFDKYDRLFIIEINCRQGGNGIPDMVKAHCGIDMYKLLVTTSVGDLDYFHKVISEQRPCRFVSRHPVYSEKVGIYRGMHFDPSIAGLVTGYDERKAIGDPVARVKNAFDVVGFVNLEFESYEQQCYVVKQLDTLIYPVLEEAEK